MSPSTRSSPANDAHRLRFRLRLPLKRLALVAMTAGATACAGGLLGARPSSRAGSDEVVVSMRTGTERSAPMADTIPPEPAPGPSNATGIARLQRLMHVWHLISLYHGAVRERGAAWDSAFVRAATVLRTANDVASVRDAYQRLFAVLNDPLTRVEEPWRGNAIDVGRSWTIDSARTADSILVLHLPLGSAQQALRTTEAASNVQRWLQSAPRRVVLDLRGSRDRAEHGAAMQTSLEEVERFVARARLVETLNTAPLAITGTRLLMIGGAQPLMSPTTVATDSTRSRLWIPEDAWVVPDGTPRGLTVDGQSTTPRRVMVLANAATRLPRSLLSWIAAGRATLIAEQGTGAAEQQSAALDEQPYVTTARVAVAESVWVQLRLSEVVQADGSTGLFADTTVVSAAQPADSAPALRAALTMLRANRTVRLSRLPVRRSHSVLPAFYRDDPYPFMGARLLAGAQLWSAIRVRHVHRDLYDDDLDAQLERMIPALESARSATEYAAALTPMVSALDDAAAMLQGASADSVKGVSSAPFRAQWVEERAIITDIVRDSETQALGITTGMEVSAADGFPMSAWITDHRFLVSAPNDWSRKRSLMTLMPRGTYGSTLFRLRDLSNRERQLNIPRTGEYWSALQLPERPRLSAERALAGDVLYIDLNRLTVEQIDGIMARAPRTRGWMLDLRGAVAPDVADRIVAAVRTNPDALVAREVRRFDREPCLAVTLRETREQCALTRESRQRREQGDTVGHYAGLLAVLIDERTVGEAERLALRLDAVARVTFVGSPSAGSAGDVMTIALPGQLRIDLPIVELRRADDSQLQRVGITPTIDARLTVRGVRSGYDDVIERAQQWMQQRLDPPVRRR